MPLSDARLLIVCVDYHDILRLTLPYNLPQFKSALIVTSIDDERTQAVAQECGADQFRTDVFYARDAAFNKYAAVEQGLDYMGREGWICIMDADIAVPTRRPEWEPRIGNLHTPKRRVLRTIPNEIPEERKWRINKYLKANEVFNGYFHLFHCDDPVLQGRREWHSTDYAWAGGGDTSFQRLWPERNKVRPPFEVLHIGEPFMNWAGRVSAYADGTVPAGADEARGTYNSMMNGRRARKYGRNPNPYESDRLQ